MDLNKLYFDHQLLLMRAPLAEPGDARQLLETGARRVARCIGSIQRVSGAAAAASWESLAALPGTAIGATLTARALQR